MEIGHKSNKFQVLVNVKIKYVIICDCDPYKIRIGIKKCKYGTASVV